MCAYRLAFHSCEQLAKSNEFGIHACTTIDINVFLLMAFMSEMFKTARKILKNFEKKLCFLFAKKFH